MTSEEATKRFSAYHHLTSYETSSHHADLKYYCYKELLVLALEIWHSLCIGICFWS